MSQQENHEKGLNAIDQLDRVIHEPARLKIMTHLYVVESGDFVYLMRTTGLTRGNLSSHMTKLEEAGYVEVIKEFIDRKPVTMLSLTDKGRTAFLEYRKNMTLAIEGSK
jgi:DNA-binding MarR family transcriptional regulator